MMFSNFATVGKEPFPRNNMALPLYKLKAHASWEGETLFKNIEFINFDSPTTWCGM